MGRGFMLAAVERRFGTTRAPHPVEWLSDNGSAYIAKDTADMARALGLTLLFTPVRSPERNGMSGGFSKPSGAITLASTSSMMPTQSLQCFPIGSRIIARSTHTPALSSDPLGSSSASVLNPTSRLSGEMGCTPPGLSRLVRQA